MLPLRDDESCLMKLSLFKEEWVPKIPPKERPDVIIDLYKIGGK